jgi:hypothetical protein
MAVRTIGAVHPIGPLSPGDPIGPDIAHARHARRARRSGSRWTRGIRPARARRHESAPAGIRGASGFPDCRAVEAADGAVTTVSLFATADFAADSHALARNRAEGRGWPGPAELRSGPLARAAPAAPAVRG